MSKHFITADKLLADAFQLTRNIVDSGFQPTALLALWRGGTPIGIGIHEGLSYLGIQAKHFALRTSYYDDNNQRKDTVQIDQIGTFAAQFTNHERLLIVDDVFDSGNTLKAVIKHIQNDDSIITPAQIKIATPYFKPKQNQTDFYPDFYLHETDDWIVFPHELMGLSAEEIKQNKPNATVLLDLPNLPKPSKQTEKA